MPKPYQAEFRRDVIAVARESEAPVAQVAKDFGQVAKDFGVSKTCLQRWLKIADREDGLAPPASSDAGGGGPKDDSAELRELRRRNKLLEQATRSCEG
ncbi:hypothetical protein GCM10027451_27940 [Geodermatophilus aquaeductus]|uniref:Transposase n=1 Tax=Geodermatophilus aquaeductus TaxID=1564161 RepID=A0A521F7Z8_9ACTN|nr:transposase [Geodermatophilus aquaeductus]